MPSPIILGSPQHLWELYQRDAANWMRVRQSRPAVPGGGAVEVAVEDYSRRFLLIENPTGNGVFVNLSTGQSVTTGRSLTNTREPIQYAWDTHGILCCQSYFAGGPIGTTLYVLELLLEHGDLGTEESYAS